MISISLIEYRTCGKLPNRCAVTGKVINSNSASHRAASHTGIVYFPITDWQFCLFTPHLQIRDLLHKVCIKTNLWRINCWYLLLFTRNLIGRKKQPTAIIKQEDKWTGLITSFDSVNFSRAKIKEVEAPALNLQSDLLVHWRGLCFITHEEGRLAFFWPRCLIEMAVYIHSLITCHFLRLQPSMRLPWRRTGSSGSNPPGAAKTWKDLYVWKKENKTK